MLYIFKMSLYRLWKDKHNFVTYSIILKRLYIDFGKTNTIL